MDLIKQIYDSSRGTYGSPRIHAELRLSGENAPKNSFTRSEARLPNECLQPDVIDWTSKDGTAGERIGSTTTHVLFWAVMRKDDGRE